MNFDYKLYTKARKQIVFWIIATISVVSLTIFVASYFLVVQRVDTYQDKIRQDYSTIQGNTMRTEIPPELKDARNELRTEVLLNLAILQGAILAAGAALSPLIAAHLLTPIRRTHEKQAAFAMNANHQIRTPLTVMFSEIEAIKMNRAPSIADYKDTINSIEEELARLLAITRELLSVASSDDNAHLPAQVSTVDQLRILTQKLGTVQNIKVAISVHGDMKTLPIGEDTLFMILDILIDNTRKHAVGKEKKAKISLKNTSKGIEFSYIDNGLRPNKQRLLKAQLATGSGQGLNILRTLLERNNAKLSLVDTDGFLVKISFSKTVS